MPETARIRTRGGWTSRGGKFVALAAVVALVGVSGVGLVTRAAAADSSAVTVSAKDQDHDYLKAPFPDLKVTVSQTTALDSQGIVISWTGAKQSTVPSQQIGGANFFQVFQCWGDDPTAPANEPRPDRTTCQYGVSGSPGATRDSFRPSEQSVAPEDAEFTAPGDGFANPTYTSIPFRAANGKVVESVVGKKKLDVDMNTNEFFTKYTTNMVPWAGSGGDGSGSVKFEVQTGLQSQGLGCGSPVTAADGSISGAPCWLVILPRGTADSGTSNITQSGLFWDSWKHRIAVKLDFKPLGVRCPIGAAERQLAGSELIGRAVASWQPVVCNEKGGAVYSAISSAESDAALVANGTLPGPLALTSRALNPDVAKDALRYAPIGITGAAISFAIDRNPRPGDPTVPDDVDKRVGLPFTTMKLTPRLVAKLLTNSYLDSIPIAADRDHLSHVVDGKKVYNPRNITYDPDFLAINDPEWAYQAIAAPSIADALVPQGRSDVAWAIWQYVISDQSARDFLSGSPDAWGMTVNPWSATDAAINKTGTALALPREDFPKADPVEQAASSTAGPINLVTWRPYVNDLDSGAYDTLRGDGLILGAWDPLGIPPKYGKADRNLPGRQAVIAVTDTASIARYQVVTAALQNPAGEFVSASVDSMTAAAAAMTAVPSQPQVYGFDPTSDSARAARSAYPLTMPVYAAVNPLMKDPALRASYAAFIRFASTTGQQPGSSLGQLPEGYVPLPEGWKTAAAQAAQDIESGTPWKASTPPSSAAPANTSSNVPFPAAATSPLGVAPAAQAAGTASATSPSATGTAASALSGAKTPDDPSTGAIAAAIPATVIGGAVSALAIPLVLRRRRL